MLPHACGAFTGGAGSDKVLLQDGNIRHSALGEVKRDAGAHHPGTDNDYIGCFRHRVFPRRSVLT
jgi:hypothetical protein